MLRKRSPDSSDNSLRIAELYQEALKSLGGTEVASKLLDMIKLEKPRYIRDQYQYLIKTAEGQMQNTVNAEIEDMIRHELWSATAFFFCCSKSGQVGGRANHGSESRHT